MTGIKPGTLTWEVDMLPTLLKGHPTSLWVWVRFISQFFVWIYITSSWEQFFLFQPQMNLALKELRSAFHHYINNYILRKILWNKSFHARSWIWSFYMRGGNAIYSAKGTSHLPRFDSLSGVLPCTRNILRINF